MATETHPPLRLLDTGVGMAVAGAIVLLASVANGSLSWYAALAQVGFALLIGGVVLSVVWGVRR
jgi:hypothetical protein